MLVRAVGKVGPVGPKEGEMRDAKVWETRVSTDHLR